MNRKTAVLRRGRGAGARRQRPLHGLRRLPLRAGGQGPGPEGEQVAARAGRGARPAVEVATRAAHPGAAPADALAAGAVAPRARPEHQRVGPDGEPRFEGLPLAEEPLPRPAAADRKHRGMLCYYANIDMMMSIISSSIIITTISSISFSSIVSVSLSVFLLPYFERRGRAARGGAPRRLPQLPPHRGQGLGLRRSERDENGVGTDGVAADVMCFERGTFWGTPVNLLLSFQKCQGVPFSSICQN